MSWEDIESNHYNTILYLTPEELFKSNILLELQWEGMKSLIPCFLKALYDGDVTVNLHEFDKVFTGLRNTVNADDKDVLAKTASLWYYFTKITHQSIGPRIGGFAEKIITRWIDQSNYCKVIGTNMTLKEALRRLFGIERNWRNRIDFVIKCNDSVSFMELRMSEHTGGRTGQESLMDKFDKVLDLLIQGPLYDKAISRGIKSIRISIAILFNEQHELIKENNYDMGRINSLINYIMEPNHIWGRIEKLKEIGYKRCNGGDISHISIENDLKKTRKICIKRNSFNIYLEILLGNEFFNEFTKNNLENLIKYYNDAIADDIWIMYSLAINELKIAKEFGRTNVRKIYETLYSDLELRKLLEKFRDMYDKGKSGTYTIKDYKEKLNGIINDCRSIILNIYDKEGVELKLLESNDVVQNYKYLKYVCIAALALYHTLNILHDKDFSRCRWHEHLENNED